MFVRFIDWLTSQKPPCAVCEELKTMLEVERYERKQMLTAILEKLNPPIPVERSETEPRAILPHTIPWRVRKEMLEREDKEKARIMREVAQTNEELEKELGVTNG